MVFAESLKRLVRSRLDCSGPQTIRELAEKLGFGQSDVIAALTALETEGICLRGRFIPGVDEEQWSDRRILARIHRYTLKQLRAQTKPVPAAAYMRFLIEWQHLGATSKLEGAQAVATVVDQLAGYEIAARAWEESILPVRVRDYHPDFLDQLHLSGRAVWLRLNPKLQSGKGSGPLRSTPIALVPRADLLPWLSMTRSGVGDVVTSGAAGTVIEILERRGASFFDDLVNDSGLLRTQCESVLGELAAAGVITADSFGGLRALLAPATRRNHHGSRRIRSSSVFDNAGRWDLLPKVDKSDTDHLDTDADEINTIVRSLLNRYGVVFKRVLERETTLPPWRYLLWALRRLEARGEVRGGRFVDGFSGEQFALPEAVDMLRRAHRQADEGEITAVSACDPLNLVGIIVPGLRIPALVSNQLAYVDGDLVGVRLGSEVRIVKEVTPGIETRVRTALIKRAPAPAAKRRSRPRWRA